jgi:hypothetical protein
MDTGVSRSAYLNLMDAMFTDLGGLLVQIGRSTLHPLWYLPQMIEMRELQGLLWRMLLHRCDL